MLQAAARASALPAMSLENTGSLAPAGTGAGLPLDAVTGTRAFGAGATHAHRACYAIVSKYKQPSPAEHVDPEAADALT